MRSFLLVQYYKKEVLKLIIDAECVDSQGILYDVFSLDVILVRQFGIYVHLML